MNLVENIKSSFKYPFLNIKQWAVLSVLFIIANIIVWSGFYMIYPIFEKIPEIWFFISVIVSIFVLGYSISILRNSIDHSDDMPGFSIKNDFINGLKHILVSLIYLLVPILVFIALANIMNVTAYSFDLTTFSFTKTVVINETPEYIESMAEQASPTLNVGITLVVSFIFFLIFGFFEIIGLCRLAKCNSIKEAFNFRIVIEEFKEKFSNLLIGIIVLCVISIVLSFIFSLFNILIIGSFISLIGYAYLSIFTYKFIGQLYSS